MDILKKKLSAAIVSAVKDFDVSNHVSLQLSSTFSTSSDWGVNPPLIQIDYSSNIILSRSSLFDSPIRSPTDFDKIEVTN